MTPHSRRRLRASGRRDGACRPTLVLECAACGLMVSSTSGLTHSPVDLTRREQRALDELLLSMAHAMKRRLPVTLELVAVDLHLTLERREPLPRGSRNGEGR
jgi:hypothetical protein